MYAKLRALILDILHREKLPIIEPVLREIPFPGQLGLALSNVFQIAREINPSADKAEWKKEVDVIADLIAEHLEASGEFAKVVSEKGYVNCFFRPDNFARTLAKRILTDGIDWGKGETTEGRVMIEYSQPNTHKAFHIGHVRNVVLGAALVRCYRYAGRDTVAANYIGDIGAHVFKSLWYFDEYKKAIEEAPTEPIKRGVWLGEIYTKADSLLTESQNLKNQAWEILKPLSASLEKFWRDDSIITEWKIDPLVRKIALNELDLFENRPPTEIAALIENLYKSSLAIYRKIKALNKIDGKHPSHPLVSDLESIISQPDFRKVWDREQEVLKIADRWYRQDPDLVSLWKKTRQWSLDDFNRIYAELGAIFDKDTVFFESEMEKEGADIVKHLEQEGIVTVSGGAWIVEIDKRLHERFNEPEQDKYRVLVLVRSDGTSLYGAKDLALARRKFEKYGIDESIYVVAIDQKFYFQQVFQVLRLMGFPQWAKCFHLPYELVMLPGGKMSSRKGQVVLYDDVMDELEARALKTVNEKNPGLTDEVKTQVARDVAKGALLYGMLRVDTNKKINFDFDEVLDFDGRSAPYVQYAAARASSILRKAEAQGIKIPKSVEESDFDIDFLPAEVDLLGLIGQFPTVLSKVVEDKKPIHLASYVYDLATGFSDFYHKCPVIDAEPLLRRSRLLLVKIFRITIDAALGLLGISAPEVM